MYRAPNLKPVSLPNGGQPRSSELHTGDIKCSGLLGSTFFSCQNGVVRLGGRQAVCTTNIASATQKYFQEINVQKLNYS